MPEVIVGVDVQASRGCPYHVTDRTGRPLRSGWLTASSHRAAARELAALVGELGSDRVAVGIDAPRHFLNGPRQWAWHRRKWRVATPPLSAGRHAEIVIHAYGLATPQWTPSRDRAGEWMLWGAAFFEMLEGVCNTFEVFPSAGYRMLLQSSSRVTIALDAAAPGPKDMLDAAVAGLIVRDFQGGLGCEVGGGDGLGAIVLPRPLPDGPSTVLKWPGSMVPDGAC